MWLLPVNGSFLFDSQKGDLLFVVVVVVLGVCEMRVSW